MIFDEERKPIEVRRSRKKEKEPINFDYRADNDIFGTNKDKKILPKNEYARMSRETSENRLTDRIRVILIYKGFFTIPRRKAK